MKLTPLAAVTLLGILLDSSLAHEHDGMMDMDAGALDTPSADLTSVTPMPWPEHKHGVPILETKLTPSQQLYWNSYNTTTYFTLNSDYQSYLTWHLVSLTISAFFLYPFVLIFNNLQSNLFIPVLSVQAGLSVLSCISYSIFITNVPDLYPGMAYSKMVTGLFVLTLLQFTFALLNSLSRWTNAHKISGLFSSIPSEDPEDGFALDDIHSPAATLYDGDSDIERSSLNNNNKISKLINGGDLIFNKLSQIPLLSHFLNSFHFLIIILFNASTWGLFLYYLALFPTMIACLNLLGDGIKVFNLLAHFIKGGVFFSLGLLSLARYCGAFERMGGSWNYSFVSTKEKSNLGLFLRLQKPGSCITSFEMLESSLILFYGCTNVFLEHLSNPGGEWAAKDLQHVSIAFMYFGTGLCGVITELKLSNWRKSLFYANVDNELLPENDDKLCVTPGFSPNIFPVFTIFWTGLLMSKHAQPTQLSTDIHVQWGSLLTYGSFFRVFTFIWLSYAPTKGKDLFAPGKPLTELVTSFCLLCGGLVFMESTDQFIEALAYRGFTPMFTINVSVGIISLLMAWIISVFAIKDILKVKLQN